MNNNLYEKQLNSELVYDGKLLKVFKDDIELSNHNQTTREYIKHNGASAVIALTKDNKVVMEKQFRYPFKDVLTEVPAGKIDSGEEPLVAAKRELKEETGYTADKWEFLGRYYPTCAYSSEVIYFYLATDLTMGSQDLDDDEFLNVELIDFDKLLEMAINDEIPDGKTQSIIMMAYLKLHSNSK